MKMCFLYQVLIYGSLLSYVVLKHTSNVNEYYPEPEYDEDYDYDEFPENNSTENSTLLFTKELSNITKSSKQTVKLVCEVKITDTNLTNAKVHFKWKVNEQTIEPDKNNKRITIKNNSKPDLQIFSSQLRIVNVDIFDKGFYECIASHKTHRIRSIAVLDVIDGKLVNGPSYIPTFKPPVFDGTQSFSTDGVTTFIPKTQRKSKDFQTSSVLPMNNGEHIINKQSFIFDKNMENLPQLNNQDEEYNSSQPFCQLYKGNTCKNYLEKKYVFVQPPFTQENIEMKLENAVLVVSQSNEISSTCSKFALPSLCFSAFPICVDAEHINLHQKEEFMERYNLEKDLKVFKNVRNKLLLQRICKEECEHLEKELCSREYAIAKRHPVIKQTMDFDECEFLPDDNDNRSKYCLSLGVERTQVINEDDTCYWDFGGSYRGVQTLSASGKKCMKWSHQSKISISEFPELSGHSYCRNPGIQEYEPFCFVEQTVKEHCGIPKCGSLISFYLIVGLVVALIVVTIIVISFYCNKKQIEKKTRLQTMSVPTADKNIYGNTGPNSPMELNTLLPTRINNIPPTRSHSSNRNGFQSIPHYTYKELTFVDELGEGAFGKVYKGDLKTKAGKVVVAVKSLKENASAKTQADFQREIELISELKHPNIICLLGVVIKQEPMCMLFEFMSEGDLHEFLITNSPGENKSLSQQQFLHIALQIAQGMDYLSENHYVHRDLAARNCLVSKDLVVKISDFGLSRDMYSCDYYRVQSKSLLPVRWMPPESILYGKFTTESDVWSYGVVLWEIYSYGLQPYYGYNNQEVINMIRSRKLLPCPDCCPSYCYVLMVECWAELAMRRPNFSEIVHRLKMWQQNGSTAGSYFEAPKVYTTQQKHSSKSSHTSDSLTVCPSFDQYDSHTWDKSTRKTSGSKLNESQSSLNSHSSSLGNRTQSTTLSNEQNGRNSRKSRDGGKNHKPKPVVDHVVVDGVNPKHTVVNSNGDSFETKLTF